MVACLFTCNECGHTWAEVGARQGRAIILKSFTGVPGGPNDPTCCAKCHSSNAGLHVIDEIPVDDEFLQIPRPPYQSPYQSVQAEFAQLASLWDGVESEV